MNKVYMVVEVEDATGALIEIEYVTFDESMAKDFVARNSRRLKYSHYDIIDKNVA